MDSFLSLFGPTADDSFTIDDDDLDNDHHNDHTHDDDLALFDRHRTAAPAVHQQSCPKPRTNHNRSDGTAAHPTDDDDGSSNQPPPQANGDGSGRCPPPMQSPSFDGDRLPPEPQLGNVEYKLKLVEPTAQRFEHLVTQMKWRLREGNGEAIYEIGVSDSGHLHGLAEPDMAASLHTLRRMAAQLGATTTVLRRYVASSFLKMRLRLCCDYFRHRYHLVCFSQFSPFCSSPLLVFTGNAFQAPHQSPPLPPTAPPPPLPQQHRPALRPPLPPLPRCSSARCPTISTASRCAAPSSAAPVPANQRCSAS